MQFKRSPFRWIVAGVALSALFFSEPAEAALKWSGDADCNAAGQPACTHPLTSSNRIRKKHIDEIFANLIDLYNTKCAACAPPVFSPPPNADLNWNGVTTAIIPGTTPIRASHISYLQTEVNKLYFLINGFYYAFSAAPTPGSIIQAAHVNELRQVMETIDGGGFCVARCGDGVVNVAGEQCENDVSAPGFPPVSGDGCSSACLTEPSCGNGFIDGAEQCDGGNLNGQTCISRGFAGGGVLGCQVNCTFDTSACNGACGQPTCYNCSGASCVVDSSGPFTTNACGAGCVPSPPVCGNGTCDIGESCLQCTQDCGVCTACNHNGICEAGEAQVAAYNQFQGCDDCGDRWGLWVPTGRCDGVDGPSSNGVCEPFESCWALSSDFPAKAGTIGCEDCGMCPGMGCNHNGVCDPGNPGDPVTDPSENCVSCPEDCGPCAACNNNGRCDEPGKGHAAEDFMTCPNDCGGNMPWGPVCGDNRITRTWPWGATETCASCPADCNGSPTGSCQNDGVCKFFEVSGFGGPCPDCRY